MSIAGTLGFRGAPRARPHPEGLQLASRKDFSWPGGKERALGGGTVSRLTRVRAVLHAGLPAEVRTERDES